MNIPRMSPTRLLVLWFALPGLIGLNVGAAERPSKPNVLLILIDDLGWQDVKCYDIDEPSPMETPNLDALASKGVMFWQGYSPSPVCAPSRAAILSGLHPARTGLTSVAGGQPPYPGNPGVATIAPFCSARMSTDGVTLAEALKAEGYVTGHSGKWHISKHHYDYPKPFHHGFDVSVHDRGVQVYMKPDRLTEFATRDPKDPYRLDENGFPFDAPQDGAMRFIKEHKDQPFFLYYATWLVHSPLVMRSEELLRKYERKLGVTLTEEHKNSWSTPGQTNPFYCAMVEQLDYYLGQIFDYLEQTDDPRWPGHKLSENTYIIFSSDNGGMEGSGAEIYTDNLPLDDGKISVREGGVRVPLIMVGPGIPKGVKTDVMANGLDFYPTILSLVGTRPAQGQIFDGCDLSTLLKQNPRDPRLVRDRAGRVRDTMVWHFPQMENTAAIRVGDYKLFRSYSNPAEKSLHQLYDSRDGAPRRSDIEEKTDLLTSSPERARALEARLDQILSGMGARLPYKNPNSAAAIPNQDQAPRILGHQQKGGKVLFRYKDNGAKVLHADLIFTQNHGREWQQRKGLPTKNGTVLATLPKGTSHYFLNLVDENNFLSIYPSIDMPALKRDGLELTDAAVFAGAPEPEQGEPVELDTLFETRRKPAIGEALFETDFGLGGLESMIVNGDGASVAYQSTGGTCLRMYEVEGLEREWMPLVLKKIRFPEGVADGIFRVSMDLMLDQAIPGELGIGLRDFPPGGGHVDAGLIRVGGEKGLRVNEQTIVKMDPGVWYHVELSGRFGKAADKMLQVSVRTKDGRRWHSTVPTQDHRFERPLEVGLQGLGKEGTAVFIDHLVVTVEN